MFQIKQDYDDHWVITHKETGKEVAEIDTFRGFRRNIKQLKVNGKDVVEIKNQKEALEKLEKFFMEIKQDIRTHKITVGLLERDMEIVENEYTINLIYNEVERIKKEIEGLEQYNLI